MTLSSLSIKENIPLAPYTSFGVGGPARYFVEVKSSGDAVRALDFAAERKLPLFALGGGSNVLISDDGFPGIVILNRIKGFQVEREGNSFQVSAGGGEDWQEFADRCVKEGWQGVECLAGIPGTVGASPVQNIGAYGQEAGQSIVRVDALETATGNSITLEGSRCGFGYRTSIFNTTATGRYLITGVTFRLAPGGKPYIAYRELEERFAANHEPSLADVRNAVMSIREGKGLLIREGFEQFKSAGSFFKNPIVSSDEFERIAKPVESCGGANWAWPLESGMVKLSAACLIQCAGFKRGYCRGEVGISPRHTLIMVNHGGASAGDIVAFASEVTHRVFERFGVVLSPEVRMVGFQGSPFESRASTI
jgi:UDP-N-acetylmuramate dehydrogenase